MDKGQDIFSKVVEKAHEVKLSEREKTALFSAVDAFVKKNPIAVTERVESEVEQAGLNQTPFIPSRFASYFSMFQMAGVHGLRPAIALAAVVVVVFAGTSAAAARSLPGDLLYPVMVHVNEPIAAAFMTGGSRVQYEIKRAQKRVNEVTALALEDRLSPSVREQVVAALDQHVSRIQLETNELVSEGKYKTAIEYTNDLEQILSSEVAISVDDAIRESREISVMLREDAEQKFISDTNSTPDNAKEIAEYKRDTLATLLADLPADASTLSVDSGSDIPMAATMSMSAKSAAPVSEEISMSSTTVSEVVVDPVAEIYSLQNMGNEALTMGNYTQAFVLYKQAFDQAEAIKEQKRTMLKPVLPPTETKEETKKNEGALKPEDEKTADQSEPKNNTVKKIVSPEKLKAQVAD